MVIQKSIIEKKYNAPMNMAIDEALLLKAIEKGIDAPVLRFYDWKKRAISIGYFQKIQAAVDLAKKSGVDFEIVRRQTGGGIVLHGNDITFSLVISEKYLRDLLVPVKTGIVESYQPVNTAVLEGIVSLLCRDNVDLSLEDKSVTVRGTKFCFSVPTKYDVVIDGRKIAGGAQRRIGGYILYQGSILLGPEPEKGLQEFFGETSVTLAALKGERVSREIAVESLIKGFKKVFGMIKTAELDSGILNKSENLSKEKYSKREWNYSR